MEFWTIIDNTWQPAKKVKHLGFPITKPQYIPEEVLADQTFFLLSNCQGLGDWAIISAMPRLLKEKYPNCRILLPSELYLKKLYGHMKNQWDSWQNPFQNIHIIFQNNPYIDGYVDEYPGLIYHDHYRIYDPKNTEEPLVEQLLKFYRFSPSEYLNSQPELYFSPNEIKQGDAIIKSLNSPSYGVFLLSNRYKFNKNKRFHPLLKTYDIPFLYWTCIPLEKTPFNYINQALNLETLPIRIQLYLRTKALVNISNQSGITDSVSRYSLTYVIPHHRYIGINYIRGVHYIK